MRLALVCALVACKQHAGPHDAPARAPHGALRGMFELTYYWVPVEDDLPGPAVARVYDRACKSLAKVSAKFAHQIAIDGVGKLADGRMLGVDGECKCPRSPCFHVVDAPWGLGAANRALVPFRSLAVDRALVDVGTPLWIEQLDGIELPGYFATSHDGCVVADDVGGNVTGHQVDWFVARQPYYLELDAELHTKQVAVYDAGDRCR